MTTEAPARRDGRHDVVIVGAGTRGITAARKLVGVTDFVILEKERGVSPDWPPALRDHLRLDREVIGSVFDHHVHTWTLTSRDGEICHARVVIAAYRPGYAPWIPNIPGRNNFRGVSFHAAAWDRDFDPAGKRIAVIGADATAGHYLALLTGSAASVKVFAYPPRRFVPRVPGALTRANRRLRRRAPAAPVLQTMKRSTIDTITTSGVRTSDGVDHDVDAIIYGTGFTIADPSPTIAGGLTLRQAWPDGMEPYLGIAVHGLPNYFLITGPDIAAQAGRIVECLQLMNRTASSRIEVRRSKQQVFNERVHLRPPAHPLASAFDLSAAGVPDAAYDGAATLIMADTDHRVRVRLTGYLDPIDGQYHWRGTVFDSLPAEVLQQSRTVTLVVGERRAPARITEQTPWGAHSIAGVGAPPFALGDVEFTRAQL